MLKIFQHRNKWASVHHFVLVCAQFVVVVDVVILHHTRTSTELNDSHRWCFCSLLHSGLSLTHRIGKRNFVFLCVRKNFKKEKKNTMCSVFTDDPTLLYMMDMIKCKNKIKAQKSKVIFHCNSLRWRKKNWFMVSDHVTSNFTSFLFFAQREMHRMI